MTDSMIERVAERMFERRRVKNPFAHQAIWGGPISYAEVKEGIAAGHLVEHALDEVKADARAAIEAMREPTEAMVNTPTVDAYENCAADMIWRSMIDAALKETPA